MWTFCGGVYPKLMPSRDVRILKDWRDLHRKADQIYKDLNEAYRNIYYQRVLLPIELQFNLNDLYISGTSC